MGEWHAVFNSFKNDGAISSLFFRDVELLLLCSDKDVAIASLF
jgi:hypothetical protein